MNDTENRFDKLQIASHRLMDTIRGFFYGNSPVTTIDNARAISALLQGIFDYYHKQGIVTDEQYKSTFFANTDRGTEVLKTHTRLASNFAKHADRDALDSREYQDCQAAHALMICGNQFVDLVDTLMKHDLIERDTVDYIILEGLEGPTVDILFTFFSDWCETFYAEKKRVADEMREVSCNGFENYTPEYLDDLQDRLVEAGNINDSALRDYREIIELCELTSSPKSGGYMLKEAKKRDQALPVCKP